MKSFSFGLLLLHLSSFAWCQVNKNEASFSFDKQYVGVVFSPYVKLWIRHTPITPDDSYSLPEIKYMLNLISQRFQSISTYGMGVTNLNKDKPWDEADSNCLIAKGAAEYNKKQNRLKITLSQGIYPNDDSSIYEKEIQHAFESTEYSNGVFPGTVWGIMYIITQITKATSQDLLNKIQEGKAKSRHLGVKVGAKASNCEEILGYQGDNRYVLDVLLKELDYIMCDSHLSPTDASAGPIGAAQNMGKKYKDLIKKFQQLSPSLQVILGETGWPSLGRSYVATSENNTIRNLYTYWTEMGNWASENRLQVYMFEAFDEPWKNIYSNLDVNAPNGRFGAEAFFGWWRKLNNNDIKAYVEKILEPQRTFEDIQRDVDKPHISKAVTTSAGPMLGILISILLIVGIVIGYLVYRLKQAKQTIDRLTEAEVREFVEGSKSPRSGNDETDTEENANNLPYNRDYELQKNKFYIEREVILGQGEFGLVFKGTIEIDGVLEVVAFKTTKSNTSAMHLKNLLSELKLMIYIGKHPNVIKLIGAYTEEIRNGIVFIAAEFCGKGSLENFLRKKSIFVNEVDPAETSMNDIVGSQYANVKSSEVEFKGKEPITRSQMDAWVLQIAQGMKYLASRKVIHSDLASRNVLVANDNSVRITDFGLSRRLYEYTSYVKASQEPLPWRWMAFESLRSLSFSPQSDVWSYGVTAWEIYSMGDIPYPGLSWDITFVQQLDRGLRMPPPAYALPEVYDKMLQCWDLDPYQRPTFQQLEEFFLFIINEE